MPQNLSDAVAFAEDAASTILAGALVYAVRLAIAWARTRFPDLDNPPTPERQAP